MQNKNFILFLMMLVAFSNIGKAQDVQGLIEQIEDQPVEIVDTLGRNYDTRELTVRKYYQDLNEEYSSGEFNYERSQTSSQNLFSRFLSWVLEGIQDIFGFTLSPFTIKILTYLFYFLIGAVVVFMIVKLVGNESASKLFGRTSKEKSSVTIEDTHIEEIDFTNLIQNNEKEGNYRNAIRFQYLSMLKSLSARKLIEWDFQKTNSDYYRELKNPDTKEQFKKVSYLYDHVWYGEFSIDESSYRDAVQEFKSIKSKAA